MDDYAGPGVPTFGPPLCRCGHLKEDHYTYVLNGHDQTRCRGCDPHTGKRIPELYAMESGSYEAAMFEAADHDFLPVAP